MTLHFYPPFPWCGGEVPKIKESRDSVVDLDPSVSLVQSGDLPRQSFGLEEPGGRGVSEQEPEADRQGGCVSQLSGRPQPQKVLGRRLDVSKPVSRRRADH